MADEITVIDIKQERAVTAFSNREAFDALIADVREAAKALIPENADMTKKKDRDAVRSLAAKIPKLKTKVDAWGASLVEDHRAKVKEMDERRREFKDDLDELRDEIRKPLTDYEKAEEARIEAINARIEKGRKLGQVGFGETSAQIQQRMDELPTEDLSTYDEFKAEAENVFVAAFTALTAAKQVALNAEKEAQEREEERAEAARLREVNEKMERERAARDSIQTIQNIGNGILNGEQADTPTLLTALRAIKLSVATHGDLIDEASAAWNAAHGKLDDRREKERLVAQAEREKADAIRAKEQEIADREAALEKAEKDRLAEIQKQADAVQVEQEKTAVREFTATASAGKTQDRMMAEAAEDLVAAMTGLTRHEAPLAIVAAVRKGAIRHIRFEESA